MHPGVPSWHSKKTLAVITTDALLRIYLSSCLGLDNWQEVYLGLRPLRESGRVQGIQRPYLLIRTGPLCMEFLALCHLGYSPAWKQDFGELPQVCCVQKPRGQARGIRWVRRECVSVSVQSCSVSVVSNPIECKGSRKGPIYIPQNRDIIHKAWTYIATGASNRLGAKDGPNPWAGKQNCTQIILVQITHWYDRVV